jgi:regulator of sigma E protease
MEGEPDELLADAFAIVQREGRVNAEAVADELGIDIERTYALLVNLSDLAAIRPYYNPELGEKPSQKDYPAAFETLARDKDMLTEYDDNHDFEAEGFTGDGQPRPLSNPQMQLEAEQSHTYKGVSVPKRLVILCAGPFVNLLLAFVLATGLFMATEYKVAKNVNVVGEVTQGSLAEAAGLKSGDTIVSVGDTAVTDWVSISDALAKAREEGKDFTITYERDGKQTSALVDMPENEIDALSKLDGLFCPAGHVLDTLEPDSVDDCADNLFASSLLQRFFIERDRSEHPPRDGFDRIRAAIPFADFLFGYKIRKHLLDLITPDGGG